MKNNVYKILREYEWEEAKNDRYHQAKESLKRRQAKDSREWEDKNYVTIN